MALKNCKECNHKISTKAETCPNCGAKQPKKTSRATWLVLILLGSLVFASMMSVEQQPRVKSNNAIEKSETDKQENPINKPVKIEEIKAPEWTTFDTKDEMTEGQRFFAISPSVTSTRPMSFPYTGVTTSLAVGCDKSNSWAYLVFSESPNLTNDETKDGYNLIPTRVKWDNQLETMSLTQDWGSRFLHFRDDEKAVEKIQANNEVLLEFNWHRQERVYFKITLNGSSKAIKEIFRKCKT